MTHPDGDTLLKYILQTLDEWEIVTVRQHLSSCEQCEEEARKIEGQVRRLSSLDIPVEIAAPPLLYRRSRGLVPMLIVAAVLAVGFLLGYAAAEFSNPVSTIPVQQRLIPSQISVPSSGNVPAQEVDISSVPLNSHFQ
jgi:hypothetical protein